MSQPFNLSLSLANLGGDVLARLVLMTEEVAVIKGLCVHTRLNNQSITAAFSYLGRNINHREIGTIRDDVGKYSSVSAASKADVETFLARYGKVERSARSVGAMPTPDNQLRVDKSIELIKSAVSIYNNPAIGFRTEIFIVNAVIAWTYALHAYFYRRGIRPVYADSTGKVVTTSEGASKLWDLSECVSNQGCPLSKPERLNLQFLIRLRNEIEHRCAPDVGAPVRAEIHACALNLSVFLEKHFGAAHSLKHELEFAIQFASIGLSSENAVLGSGKVSAIVSTVNKAIHAGADEADLSDMRYAFRVHIIPVTANNPKKADEIGTMDPFAGAPNVAIKQVEKKKYRASDLVKILRADGARRFTIGKFIEIWKGEDLKNPAKGLCICLGGQWFWYEGMLTLLRGRLLEDHDPVTPG